MNFSICLIARNESKTLPRLVGSLKEFQERGGVILLLDTGSTDNTAQIARDLGCIVHEVGEKFLITVTQEQADEINSRFIDNSEMPVIKAGDKQFDYASARNYIADFAPTDVIATPDCDEIYTKFDINAISIAIQDGVDQLEYNFVFSHDEFGNEAIKFMHSKFYNRKKLKWQGIIHEVLVGDANRQFLSEDLIKLEHFQNPETNRGHYLRGLAIDCYRNPMNDRNAHYFGRELLWTDRPISAIKQLEYHLKISSWKAERQQSMLFIGDAYAKLGKDEEAIAWYNKAINEESGRREPFIRLAEYYYKNNNAQLAASYAAASLEIPWSTFYANFKDHYENLPHEILYWAKWRLGDVEGSKYHWQKCIEYRPLNHKYLHDARFYLELPIISFVLTHMGKNKERVEGLERCVNSIANLNYPQDKIDLIILEDTLEDRRGVPFRMKEGVEKSIGKYIVYASNDTEFEPDSIIIALFELLNDRDKFLLAFNTGEVLPDEGNICEHFMFKKSFLDLIGGEIFDTQFHHVGVDNLLWAKCKKFDGAIRSKNAIVKHYHFSKGAAMDEIYTLGWSEVESDRKLLKEKLKTL